MLKILDRRDERFVRELLDADLRRQRLLRIARNRRYWVVLHWLALLTWLVQSLIATWTWHVTPPILVTTVLLLATGLQVSVHTLEERALKVAEAMKIHRPTKPPAP